MIRDPSDGSVRDVTAPASNEINQLTAKTAVSGIIQSGLPTASARPQMIAKLEKSREWLKNYHDSKGMK